MSFYANLSFCIRRPPTTINGYSWRINTHNIRSPGERRRTPAPYAMRLRNTLTPTTNLEGSLDGTSSYPTFNLNNTSDLDNKHSASKLTMHSRWANGLAYKRIWSTARTDGCGRVGAFVIILNV